MDDRLREAPVGVFYLSATGTVTDSNETARSLVDVTASPIGTPLAEVFPRSVDDSVLAAVEGETVAETAFEEYYPELERWLSVAVVDADDGAAVFVRDVTDRRRVERTLERRRQERERTAVIDDVLSQILGDLVDATSRTEIAETICRGLGETDLYEFAWVGERAVGRDRLVSHAVAGDTGETFATVRDALGDEAVTTPEEQAVDTGRIQIVQPLTDSASVPEAVRTAGFADGVQSALAIPLVHASNVHGVVGVYADGTEAFSARERDSFQALSDVAGFAVTAVRNRTLLLADGVAEITFALGDGTVLGGLSRALDATVRLDGTVPQGEDALCCFVSIEDAGTASVVDVASDIDGVDDVRLVGESDSSRTVELAVVGGTPLLSVSALGGTIRRATADCGTGELVIDLPRDGDVRRVVETVSRESDAEFVAKAERERSVTTARGFREDLSDRLTEHQETALRTAYVADYFESPRGSTAEEVASALDITGSTLLHHLRAAQRKLLAAYFTDGGRESAARRDGG
jgi:predicted DNA binding protein